MREDQCSMTNILGVLVLSIVVGYMSSAAAPDKPPVLFLRSYFNYAWGYMHNGWLIDSSGAIRNFNFTLGDSMYYGAYEMPPGIYNRLVSKSVLTGKKVSADTLLAMQALADSASKGIVTYMGRCADAGTSHYSAFVHNKLDSNYKEVVCYQSGDITGCNSSLAARAIARWLISLDSLPLPYCTPPDSCLNPTSGVTNPAPALVRNAHSSSLEVFYLNGKKAAGPARQIMVNKNGKAALDLKKPDR